MTQRLDYTQIAPNGAKALGGIYGYMALLESISHPEDEGYEEAVDILGEDFLPEQFGKEEITEINALLKDLD